MSFFFSRSCGFRVGLNGVGGPDLGPLCRPLSFFPSFFFLVFVSFFLIGGWFGLCVRSSPRPPPPAVSPPEVPSTATDGSNVMATRKASSETEDQLEKATPAEKGSQRKLSLLKSKLLDRSSGGSKDGESGVSSSGEKSATSGNKGGAGLSSSGGEGEKARSTTPQNGVDDSPAIKPSAKGKFHNTLKKIGSAWEMEKVKMRRTGPEAGKELGKAPKDTPTPASFPEPGRVPVPASPNPASRSPHPAGATGSLRTSGGLPAAVAPKPTKVSTGPFLFDEEDVPTSPRKLLTTAPHGYSKRYRRVAMGEAHSGFLTMMMYSCCHPSALRHLFLSSSQEITVPGHGTVACSSAPSEQLLLDWLRNVNKGAGSMVPAQSYRDRGEEPSSEDPDDDEVVPAPDPAQRQQLVQLAKAAWDVLVVRASQMAVFTTEQLFAVTSEQLRSVAARRFTESENLRLPGSEALAQPRDRFNPFTHTPQETVHHQTKLIGNAAARFRIPYPVAFLTWAMLRKFGLEENGIFRVSPDSHHLDDIRRFIVTENWTEFHAKDFEAHVFAAMLKNYFNTLSTPLFPDASLILQLFKTDKRPLDWPTILNEVLSNLNGAHLMLVWWWVSLCRLIASYEHSSAMGLKQLVVCWAPCLIRLQMEDLRALQQDTEICRAFLGAVLKHHPWSNPVGEAVVGMRCQLRGQAETLIVTSFGSKGKTYVLQSVANPDVTRIVKNFEDMVFLPELNNDFFPVTEAEFFRPYVRPKAPDDGEDYFELEERCTPVLQNIDILLRIIDEIPINDQTDFMERSFAYLHRRHLVFPLLERLVQREVEAAKSLNMLWRTNSPATKLLKVLFYAEGSQYQKSVLGPIIRDICRQNVDLTLNDADTPTERDQKRIGLSEVANMVVFTIINSVQEVPAPLRACCSLLVEAVSRKFSAESSVDDCILVAVGGLFFLRFVNPIFMTSIKTAPPNATHTLKNVAKMMQALVAFGGSAWKEEAWPEFALELITVPLTQKMMPFLQAISRCPDAGPQGFFTTDCFTDDDAVKAFEALVYFVRKNFSAPDEQFHTFFPASAASDPVAE